MGWYATDTPIAVTESVSCMSLHRIDAAIIRTSAAFLMRCSRSRKACTALLAVEPSPSCLVSEGGGNVGPIIRRGFVVWFAAMLLEPVPSSLRCSLWLSGEARTRAGGSVGPITGALSSRSVLPPRLCSSIEVSGRRSACIIFFLLFAKSRWRGECDELFPSDVAVIPNVLSRSNSARYAVYPDVRAHPRAQGERAYSSVALRQCTALYCTVHTDCALTLVHQCMWSVCLLPFTSNSRTSPHIDHCLEISPRALSCNVLGGTEKH